MVIGIDTVFCQVDDMDRATTFYRDVLRLNLTFGSEFWTSFDVGGLKLALHHRISGEAGISTGNFVCGVRVASLDQLKAALLAAGVWCAEDYHQIPGGQVLDFRDTEGNWLQGIERS